MLFADVAGNLPDMLTALMVWLACVVLGAAVIVAAVAYGGWLVVRRRARKSAPDPDRPA